MLFREESHSHPMALSTTISHHSLQRTPQVNRGGFPTHKRQLGYHNAQHDKQIDGEIRQVIIRVVGAEQEQHDGHAEQKLLGGGVLIPVVDLLPHVEVVVGARVEVEGHAAHPVEHEVGAAGIADVGEEPRGLLRDARHDVEEELEGCDEHDVDGPGTCVFAETRKERNQRGGRILGNPCF